MDIEYCKGRGRTECMTSRKLKRRVCQEHYWGVKCPRDQDSKIKKSKRLSYCSMMKVMRSAKRGSEHQGKQSGGYNNLKQVNQSKS